MFSNKAQSAGMMEVSLGNGVYSVAFRKRLGCIWQKIFCTCKAWGGKRLKGGGGKCPLKCNPAIMLVLIPSDKQNWAPCSFCRYREQPTPLSNQ